MHHNATAECAMEECVPAYVQGELDGPELVRFERHLAGCENCRRQVAETREVIGRMKALPVEPLQRDLAPAILAGIPDEAWAGEAVSPRAKRCRAMWFLRAAAVAASAAVVFAGLWAYMNRRPAGPGPGVVRQEVVRGLEWLTAAQAEDGSWDPEQWGGQAEYRVGLTGLALLAFLGAGETPDDGRFGGTLSRGLAYLVKQQDSDGLVGEWFSGAIYNHGIASTALLEAYACTGDKGLKRPIAAAVGFICENQAEGGGWGYLGSTESPNTSVTTWQLQALFLAGAAGWPEARASAGKGLAWLAETVDGKGHAGYRRQGDFPYGPGNLSAMAAFCLFMGAGDQAGSTRGATARALAADFQDMPERPDYCRYYFVSHALQAVRALEQGETPVRGGSIAELDRSLVNRQVKAGPQSGSWDPCDQWGSAGGRVYSTAMATLSLEAGHRARRLLAWVGETPR